MDTDSFRYEMETDDSYRKIAKDTDTRFDTSKCLKDDKRSLPIEKKQKVIGVMKDELNGKIIIELLALRAKMYRIERQTKKWKISAAEAQKMCGR